VQVTPAELAAELTTDLGLAVQAACPGPLWPHILQAGQTDLELLAEIGERCGLYLTLRGGALHLITLEGLDGPVPLALGDTLLEARVEMNRDGSCPAVHALAWDTSRAEARRGGAKAARSGRATPAAEMRPWPRGGERTLVDAVGPADEHAAALAQGELDRAAAGELHLWGVAQGDPRLRPGCRIEVAGLPGGLSGRYVITGANHVITPATGYVTEIWTAPPPPQPRAQAGLVTLGVVTRVDDPEGLGRVRVRLPTCGDAETDWTQVACPGAGPDKGLTVLPDVGDRVLVVGSRAEPAHAIVIGGLCGAEGARDPGVEGGAVRRYTLRSAGGLRVRLDDTEGAIRVETGDGSFLELAPGGVRLHAKAPLVIEAPGQPVVVRGASIDFERA
jgi:phage baseplate assembly protein gpV